MKALICKKFGSIQDLVWSDLDEAFCGDRQVRYRTVAATIGFMDTLMVRGLYQLKPPIPYVPGAVSSGVVTEVGCDVKGIHIGQRISALDYYGAFAEERVVDEEAVVVIPETIEYEQAAAFRLTFTPSYLALVNRAFLQPGEVLVVTGASGGIGFSAMQLGRYFGARVIGGVSSSAKESFLHGYGFDETINYSRDSFKDRVNELTQGKGADVIFEVVGGEIFNQSLRCINVFGRILVLGFASGQISNAPANLPLLKNCSVIGSFLGGWMKHDPESFITLNKVLMKLLVDSGLKVPIAKTFSMSEGVDAMEMLTQRHVIGKIMLRA